MNQSTNKLPPTIIFIFGGSGDLAYRKLLPALYNLYIDKYLPEKYFIYGLGRTEFNENEYLDYIKKGIASFSRRKENLEETWQVFSPNIDYIKADLEQDATYKDMADKIALKEKEWDEKVNIMFYMSVAPQMAPMIATKLHHNKLTTDPLRSRIVFEKPFGHDLKSARELNVLLGTMFKEEQIYRIDHYLGKETVQNIIALRFANALFEPLWNSNYIDHIQITAAEDIGVEGRGSYYEGAGALRDMVQNHILQLVCMIAMEAPVSFAADEIRNKKLDVL
ncbi:MAG TPA: glucose-6-phosphate dehydrogenase, partial [Flavisolibacter sp.]|nr:glucose-6-phosphate dehydrogenase [Flavisolibacter sp.]